MGQMANSMPAKRQQNIMEYLNIRRSITIKEAADLCKVSEATAGRDLDELSGMGFLERTYGGAVLERGTGFEREHDEKMKIMIPEKARIAQKAAGLIKNGCSIFLDSGTTTLLLARMLQGFQNLTVVTHNLDIAYSIKLDKSSTLIVTGGIRRDGYSVLIGQIAEELVNRLSLDMAFLGADAINPNYGVFNSNFVEIGIKRSAIACGKHRILLSDHTKFQTKALTKVCDIEEFETVITDDGIDEETKEILRNKSVNLITA